MNKQVMTPVRIMLRIPGLFAAILVSLGVFLASPGVLLAQDGTSGAEEIGDLLAAGRYLDVVEPLELALDQARREGADDQEARALHDLSVAFLGLGRLDQAREHLTRAVSLAEEAGVPALAASALDNLGTVHASRPDERALALDAYGRAVELAEAEGYPGLAFNALTNQARLELDGKRTEQALSALERARTHLEATPDSAAKTADILLLGRLLARSGATEDGFAALGEARRRAEDAGDQRTEALAAGYLADIYADAGRDADAVLLYDQATFLAQAVEAPELVYRWQWPDRPRCGEGRRRRSRDRSLQDRDQRPRSAETDLAGSLDIGCQGLRSAHALCRACRSDAAPCRRKPVGRKPQA